MVFNSFKYPLFSFPVQWVGGLLFRSKSKNLIRRCPKRPSCFRPFLVSTEELRIYDRCKDYRFYFANLWIKGTYCSPVKMLINFHNFREKMSAIKTEILVSFKSSETGYLRYVPRLPSTPLGHCSRTKALILSIRFFATSTGKPNFGQSLMSNTDI